MTQSLNVNIQKRERQKNRENNKKNKSNEPESQSHDMYAMATSPSLNPMICMQCF